MPPKKATSTASSSASTSGVECTSERLELAKAISNLSSKADGFVKAVESFQQFNADKLTQLDLDIASRKAELQDIRDRIAYDIKNGKIEVDQTLKEYKREGAVRILTELNEVVVVEDKWNQMNEELKTLRAGHENAVNEIRKEEASKKAEAIAQITKNHELKNKAELAELVALNKQQEREIASLRATIQELRADITAQRNLTREVAEASGKSGGGFYHHPSEGRGK